MNQKELTKTFMMISNWKKNTYGFHNLNKTIQRLKGYAVNDVDRVCLSNDQSFTQCWFHAGTASQTVAQQ